MRADPARLQSLDIAFAFGRADVDALLDEITADEFDEWAAYLTIRPHGWQAFNMLAGRIAWAAMQPHSQKPVNEKRLMVRLDGESDPAKTAAWARARLEVAAARGAIRERIAAERKTG